MSELSLRVVKRGINYSIASAAAGGFLVASTAGAVFSGLLLALEMNPVLIGIVMSVPMLCLPLQMVGAEIQSRFFNRKKFWIVSGLFQHTVYLILAVLICFRGDFSLSSFFLLFLLFYALYCGGGQFPASVGFAWMGALVPPRESNTYWNRRFAFYMLVVSASMVCTGKLVDWLGRHEIFPYLCCMGLAAGAGYLMVGFQSRVPDVPETGHARRSLWIQFRIVWHNRDFRTLILFFAFQSLTLQLSCPFIFVYLQGTNGMNYSLTVIQLLGALSGLIGFASAYFFRIVGNRYGRKPLLILCTLLKSVEFFGWFMLIPRFGLFFTLWVFIFGGFVNTGLASTQMSLLTSVGKRRMQGFSIGLFSTVIGFCGFIGSFLSGFLYDGLQRVTAHEAIPFDPFNLLALVSGIGLIFSVAILLPFRENGAASARSVVKTIFTGNPIRNLYQAYVITQPLSEEKRVHLWHQADGDLLTNSLMRDLYSPSGEVRESTIISISRLRGDISPALVDELIKILKQPDLGCQTQAAHALGILKAERAVPDLIHLMHDSDRYLAQACIYALGLIGDSRAVPELCSVLNLSRKENLWPVAAESLGKLGDVSHVRLMYRALSLEHNWVMRRQALIALCKLVSNDKKAVFALFESEEKNTGSILEDLLKKNLKRLPVSTVLQSESLLQLMDSGRGLEIMRRFLCVLLPLYGFRETELSGFDTGSFFIGSGGLRDSVFNQNSRSSVLLWLLMNFWAELSYDSNTPENLLLGFHLVLDELLSDRTLRSVSDGNSAQP